MADTTTSLSPEQLRRECDPTSFSFASTEELEPLDQVIGQDRAVRAISFGIDISSPGYHMYAMGPIGTGKTTTIRKLLEGKASDRPVPDDWLYVNNFEDSDRPRALHLPAGVGCAFAKDMNSLVDELGIEVPKAFEGEQYEREIEQIQDQFKKKQQEIMEQMNQQAEESNFRLVQTPRGTFLAPVKDDEIVTPDELSEMEEGERNRLEQRQEELGTRMRESARAVQGLQREAKEKVREVDREVVKFAVDHLIDELREKYGDYEAVLEFLAAVRNDIIQQAHEIKQAQEKEEMQKQLPLPVGGGAGVDFDRYRVNLLVDRCESEGAPVILERNPSSHNLVGRIEHEAQFGALVTNFTMIRAGALHRANGGYLLIEARDVLTRPFAWGTLKRTLKDKQVKIETMAEDYQVISTRSLRPEPIPLDVKVVLIGDAMVYHLLFNLDEEFRELFKVKADFGVQTEWSQATLELYARFVASMCREEELRHFEPEGVARLVEHAARMASDQGKLATTFSDLLDLVREASFWAGRNGHDLVGAADVRQAVNEKIYRANRIEERLRELIANGTILIATDEEVVGQVNGLSVMMLGDYAFGRPSRITARTHVGGAGVVNIERETKMGGRIHNKGVMILTGFLGGRFAQDVPLALSASLTFEQLYEGVEGDSASSTELYALLSSLSGIPLRQDLAVTGSVNQLGEVQAIGGVNEKIEGFFKVCREAGLTGRQGVLIPAANVRHLMLDQEVVEAVGEGRFHIYPVRTVEEGIELLTGTPAGEVQDDGSYPEGTVFRAVAERLHDLAVKGKSYARPKRSKENGDGNGEDANARARG